MAIKFIINLVDAHKKSGKTAYRVAKDTRIAAATIHKYIHKKVEADYIPQAVVILATYYGADWRTADVITVVTDDTEPEIKTPLLASA